MITSLRPFIGVADPCRQRDRDHYLDGLFRALVRRNELLRKAAKAKPTAPELPGWLVLK